MQRKENKKQKVLKPTKAIAGVVYWLKPYLYESLHVDQRNIDVSCEMKRILNRGKVLGYTDQGVTCVANDTLEGAVDYRRFGANQYPTKTERV